MQKHIFCILDFFLTRSNVKMRKRFQNNPTPALALGLVTAYYDKSMAQFHFPPCSSLSVFMHGFV